MEGKRAPKKIRDYMAVSEMGCMIEPFNTKSGVELVEEHRSKPCTQEDVDWADMIIYMDGGNLKRLQSFKGAAVKARCLGAWVNQGRIADPNFMPKGEALDELLRSIEHAAKELYAWLSCSTVRPHSAAL
jgi:protein-tyrosine-phosphatase